MPINYPEDTNRTLQALTPDENIQRERVFSLDDLGRIVADVNNIYAERLGINTAQVAQQITIERAERILAGTHYQYDQQNSGDDMNAPIYQNFPSDNVDTDIVFALNNDEKARQISSLQDRYPSDVYSENGIFGVPVVSLLVVRRLRNNVRQAIRKYRQLRAARTYYLSNELKRYEFVEIFGEFFSESELRIITNERDRLKNSSCFRNVKNLYSEYRRTINVYNQRRRVLLPQRKTYLRELALIEQREYEQKLIRATNVVKEVSKWPNVFAASAQMENGISVDDERLIFRFGLCNIVMSESSTNPPFEYSPDVPLAPFVVTAVIERNGRVRFPSFMASAHEGADVHAHNPGVFGFSRSARPYGLSYDVHPHQLSDSACFGTFDQTLIDAGREGDIVSVLSVLIGFYSQYNSSDSAGRLFAEHHPAWYVNAHGTNDEEPIDRGMFFRAFYMSFRNRTNCAVVFDNNKLLNATDAFLEYWNDPGEPPKYPSRMCVECNEVDVALGTGNRFFFRDDDEAVCESCWNEHYCHTCCRNVENIDGCDNYGCPRE
jgi:hypothetical protein